MSKINFPNILKKQLEPTQFVGMEYCQTKEGTRIGWTLFKREKGNIILVDQNYGEASLQQLKEKFSGIPIYLTITGKGILFKLAASREQQTAQTLDQLFPNIKKTAFHFQHFPVANGTYIALIRRSRIIELLQEFRELGLSICQINLGPFSIQFLQPKDSADKLDLLSGYAIDYANNGQIDVVKPSSETSEQEQIHLDGEQVSTSNVLSYAQGIAATLELYPGLSHPSIIENKQELFHARLFKKSGVALAAGFFLLLLINLVFFYYYDAKNQELAVASLATSNKLTQYETIRVSHKEQSKLLKETGINKASRATFYADKIGQTLPSALSLETLTIFPLIEQKKKFGKKELEQFNGSEIHIKGWTSSSEAYQQWVEKLESEEWVEDIKHLNYRDEHTQRASFELKIILAPS